MIAEWPNLASCTQVQRFAVVRQAWSKVVNEYMYKENLASGYGTATDFFQPQVEISYLDHEYSNS